MSMFDRMADAIIKRAIRTPYEHLPGYMERYWLLPYGRQRYAVRVHHILRSDTEREFHDHPWNYCTLILRGGYTEVKPVFDSSQFYHGETRATYTKGDWLWRPAKSWHRLELDASVDTWTLFMTGKQQQKWGFLVEPEFKMYWRDLLAERQRYLTHDSSEGNHDDEPDSTLFRRGREQ